MKTLTKLAAAIKLAAKDERLTHAQAAERCGLNRSVISLLVTRERRPDATTLRAILTGWKPQNKARLLIAHLQDEIYRAGYTGPEIEIQSTGIPLQKSLDQIIHEISTNDPEIAHYINDLIMRIADVLESKTEKITYQKAAETSTSVKLPVGEKSDYPVEKKQKKR